jgi:tetratricopeptide (TPR) repeat protein
MLRRTIDLAYSVNQPLQAAAALTVVARTELGRGRLEEALAAAHEATRILQPPADAKEELIPQKMVYALALTREGAILGAPDGVSLDRPRDAMPLLERAFSLSDAAANRDPNESLSRQRLATAGLQLGVLLSDSDPERAITLFDRALQRLGELRENPSARLNEVRVLAASTYPLRAVQRAAEARARLDAAFARLGELKRYPGAPVKAGSEAAEALAALADDEAGRGNMAHAIDIYQKLVDQVFATAPKVETDLADATVVSRLYASLAALERRAGRSDEAAAFDARRTQIWQRWEKALPGNPFVARQIASISPLFR